MKAVEAAFNQEKALVGAFSVITNLWMELFEALLVTVHRDLHPPALVPAPRPVDDQRPVVSVDLGPDRGVVTLKYYQNILKHFKTWHVASSI